jgi:hypothetical protein
MKVIFLHLFMEFSWYLMLSWGFFLRNSSVVSGVGMFRPEHVISARVQCKALQVVLLFFKVVSRFLSHRLDYFVKH